MALAIQLQGRAVGADSSPADRVALHAHDTQALAALATPGPMGDWQARVPPGSYDISYFKAGHRPVLHGPYEAAHADPMDAYVVAQLDLKRAPGSAVLDDTLRVWGKRGATDFALAPDGTPALMLNGATAPGLGTPASADLSFTGDFTLEFSLWLMAGTPASSALLSSGASWSADSCIFYLDSRKLTLVVYGPPAQTGSGVVPVGQWASVVATRRSGVLRFVVDGALHLSASFSAEIAFGKNQTLLGAAGWTEASPIGYLRSCRMTAAARPEYWV